MAAITAYLQFSSATVLLFCAVLLVAARTRNFSHFNLAGLYIALSGILFSQWIFRSGNAASCRYLLFQDNSVAFLIGPCVFFYLKTITGGSLPKPGLYALNFIPVPVCAGATLYEDIVNSRIAETFTQSSPDLADPAISPLIYGLSIISSVLVYAYILFAIFAIAPVIQNRKHRSSKELRFVLVYMLCIATFITGYIISGMAGRPAANFVFLSLLLSCGALYFIFAARFPDFAYNATREGRAIRNDNNPVNPDDAAAVTRRLDELMRTDRIFTEETLTLNTTAEKIGITPHLLSRVLNTTLGTNFRGYLNTWRIEEAKRLLSAEDGMSVLEIAYRTGFNSKSSFNDTFLKMTGKSPRDFRNGRDPGKETA